jgi:hypothetical protein
LFGALGMVFPYVLGNLLPSVWWCEGATVTACMYCPKKATRRLITDDDHLHEGIPVCDEHARNARTNFTKAILKHAEKGSAP